MSYWSIVLMFVFLALFPSASVAQGSFSTRALDAMSAKTLDRAMARSASVRAMVSTLEKSNVIVHIQTSLAMPQGIGGTTQFVASRGGYRYVRITIGADQSQSAKVAILGHELQHACEMAQSTADDAREMLSLYERDGHRHGDYFETNAAIETERSVRLELHMRKTLQAEPVVKFDH